MTFDNGEKAAWQLSPPPLVNWKLYIIWLYLTFSLPWRCDCDLEADEIDIEWFIILSEWSLCRAAISSNGEADRENILVLGTLLVVVLVLGPLLVVLVVVLVRCVWAVGIVWWGNGRNGRWCGNSLPAGWGRKVAALCERRKGLIGSGAWGLSTVSVVGVGGVTFSLLNCWRSVSA